MTAEAGQTVGDLVLRHKLAEGGMGSVWVAEHLRLGREVAVKFLAKSAVEAEESRQRFSLEANVVTRIDCAHVPEVYDLGVTEDGTPYMVMALVDGMSLTAWVAERGPLSVSQVARLVDHIGSALTAAHRLGVVHRDVKPSNILLAERTEAAAPRIGGRKHPPHDEDFHAFLIDFGIAKAAERSGSALVTHPGMTIGTPSYMSPEQLMSSAALDARADIWSLGVVTYWCLAGRLPFDGKTFRDLCLAIYCGDFVPVSTLRPDLPKELDRWFSAALAGDLERRFSSVEAMSRAFQIITAESSRAADRARLGRNDASTCETLTALPAVAEKGVVTRVPGTERMRRARGARGARGSTVVCGAVAAFAGALAAYVIATSVAPKGHELRGPGLAEMRDLREIRETRPATAHDGKSTAAASVARAPL